MSTLSDSARSWPRTAPAAVTVTIKSRPEDFRVDESLPFQPTGDGEHLLVKLSKTNIGTPELARLIADAHGIDRQDVGYAGMKDKRAVTAQWFSLRGVTDLDETVTELDGIRVLARTRHRQKLRRGQVGCNTFTLVLRDPQGGDPGPALDALARSGAPNYFGGQRFGWDNLDRAVTWLARRRRARLSPFRQGLYLSVLRSFLFNEVLAARIRDGTWCERLPGDFADGRGDPTGPLWGRGRSAATAAAADVEQAALAPHAAILDGLEHAGLAQARRSLVMRPRDLCWTRQDDRIDVTFSLGPGEYATSLLGDAFELREADTRGETEPDRTCPGAVP